MGRLALCVVMALAVIAPLASGRGLKAEETQCPGQCSCPTPDAVPGGGAAYGCFDPAAYHCTKTGLADKAGKNEAGSCITPEEPKAPEEPKCTTPAPHYKDGACRECTDKTHCHEGYECVDYHCKKEQCKAPYPYYKDGECRECTDKKHCHEGYKCVDYHCKKEYKADPICPNSAPCSCPTLDALKVGGAAYGCYHPSKYHCTTANSQNGLVSGPGKSDAGSCKNH